MSSTHDLFGGGTAEPASPGSYGDPPPHFRLPDGTRLGPVRLQVADLARSLAFYEGLLGFAVLSRTPDRVDLAAHGESRPLLHLHARAGARPAPTRGRLGLFHVALLLPERAALGRFAGHLAARGVRAGAADHLVSEAFYLQDPDNLGLEVYADRPRAAWRRSGRELMMATDPVDAAGLLREAGATTWDGMPAGTAIGHLHLHVGDLARADAFYRETLGFDCTVWRYPGARFFAAGGYHHHLGTNTWAGSGAAPPTAADARLLEWTVELPAAAHLDAVAERLRAAGCDASRDGDAVVAHDPWATRLRLVTA
jgi:catechol 2,3-dioxygenase